MSDDEKEVTTEQTLRDIYYSPTQGFRSAENVYLQAKKQLPNLKRKTVTNFLKTQKVYTKYKSHKGVKQFLPTYVRDFDQLQVDLVDFTLSKTVNAVDNDGYNYIVTAIEILSRFAFTSKSKRKSKDVLPKVMEELLEDFFHKFKRYPKVVQFDKGSEFLNEKMGKLLDEKDIEFWVSGTARKAAVVERFNRTLKEKMMKYFAHKKENRWVDVLPQLTENYNSQVNRSIGMAPKNVNEENKHQVWIKLYGAAKGPVPKPKFEVGERVQVLDKRLMRG